MLAHLVDDLARLDERELDRGFERGVAVGADEAVLLAHARDLLLDHARGLVAPAVLEWGGAQREAVVLDRLAGWRVGGGGAGAEQGFPERHGASRVTTLHQVAVSE